MIKVPPKIVCQEEKGIPKALGKCIWCKMGIEQDRPTPTPHLPPPPKKNLSLITHCSRLQIARKKLGTAASKRQDKTLVKKQNTHQTVLLENNIARFDFSEEIPHKNNTAMLKIALQSF